MCGRRRPSNLETRCSCWCRCSSNCRQAWSVNQTSSLMSRPFICMPILIPIRWYSSQHQSIYLYTYIYMHICAQANAGSASPLALGLNVRVPGMPSLAANAAYSKVGDRLYALTQYDMGIGYECISYIWHSSFHGYTLLVVYICALHVAIFNTIWHYIYI
jgi:hypothetical protein